MKALPIAMALVCLTPGLRAQENPVPDGVPPAAAAAYAKLVVDHDGAMKEYRDAVAKIAATDEHKQALKERDRAKIDELRQKMPRFDPAPFLERARAGAKEYAATEGAVDFLIWLATNDREKESVVATVDTLVNKHLDSARLGGFVSSVSRLQRHIGADRCREILTLAADESPHELVRAQAIFATYNLVSRDRNASAEAKAEAEQKLELAAALAEGTPLADQISGPMFIKNRLQIGMVAPDIEGEDLDGVPFKLSDYRGKVVVIDFWGDW